MAKAQSTTTPAGEKPQVGTPPKIPKVRSPNYPVIDLGKAVEKAKALHDAFRTSPVSSATAAVKMGYKADSSVGGQTIAALRAFGLIVAEGSGASRKVRVSADGEKIVLNHPSRSSLLQTAALLPRVHREMWDRFYAGKAAPDPDTLISHYLQWDRVEGKFNPESIGPVISQFKRTVQFAKLDSSSRVPVGASEDTDSEEGGDEQMEQTDTKPKTQLPPGSREFSFPLMDGVATLRVPHPMGEENYNLLKAVLEAMKAALIGPKASTNPTNEGGQ